MIEARKVTVEDAIQLAMSLISMIRNVMDVQDQNQPSEEEGINVELQKITTIVLSIAQPYVFRLPLPEPEGVVVLDMKAFWSEILERCQQILQGTRTE